MDMDPPTDNNGSWDGNNINNPFAAMAANGVNPFGGMPMPFPNFFALRQQQTQGEGPGNSADLTEVWDAINEIRDTQASIVKAFESNITVVEALKENHESTLRNVASHSNRIRVLESETKPQSEGPHMSASEQKAKQLPGLPAKPPPSSNAYEPGKATDEILTSGRTNYDLWRTVKELTHKVTRLERENRDMQHENREMQHENREMQHAMQKLRNDTNHVVRSTAERDQSYIIDVHARQNSKNTALLEGDGYIRNKVHNLMAQSESQKRRIRELEVKLGGKYNNILPLDDNSTSGVSLRHDLRQIATQVPVSETAIAELRSALVNERIKSLQEHISSRVACAVTAQNLHSLWNFLIAKDSSRALQERKRKLDIQHARAHSWKGDLLNALTHGPSKSGTVGSYRIELDQFSKAYDMRIHGPKNPINDRKFCGPLAASALVKCCDLIGEHFKQLRLTGPKNTTQRLTSDPPRGPAAQYRSRTPPSFSTAELTLRQRKAYPRGRSASPRREERGRYQPTSPLELGECRRARVSSPIGSRYRERDASVMRFPPERRDGRLSSPYSGRSSPKADNYTPSRRGADAAVMRPVDQFRPYHATQAHLATASSWAPADERRLPDDRKCVQMEDHMDDLDAMLREEADKSGWSGSK